MANDEHVRILKEGVKVWNRWREEHREVLPELSGADFASADLGGADLSNADLRGANLSRTQLDRADLSTANLRVADLSDASLINADLGGVNLSGADLRYTDLTGALLYEMWINKDTSLSGVRFEPTHHVLTDGSDTIELPRRESMLNWAKLRGIGQFPLFGVSWISLGLSLAVVNLVGWTIETLTAGDAAPTSVAGVLEWLEVTLGWVIVDQVPLRARLIVASSLLLVIGSTLYRTCCPSRVQEFSETQFVEELKLPRLLYIDHKLRRGWLQWLTLVCTVVGGLMALALMGERLWAALRYSQTFTFPPTILSPGESVVVTSGRNAHSAAGVLEWSRGFKWTNSGDPGQADCDGCREKLALMSARHN